MDFQRKKYLGHFKDFSNTNSNSIISEGDYDEAGLKDGDFTEYYLNGNLLAKGVFKDDHYTGKWTFYYEDGQPQIIFDASDKGITLLSAWDSNHKKIIKNGAGYYSVPFLRYIWTGNIANGRPDGDWICVRPDKNEPPIETERFADGHFVNGKNVSGIYTDSSRIVLLNMDMLPLRNAEKMLLSGVGCTVPVSYTSKLVSAKFDERNGDLTNQIQDASSNYIARLHWGGGSITITGDINEKGALINLKSSRKDLDRGLILGLQKSLSFIPATVDGKPAKQGFVIIFSTINGGLYSFSFRLLAVQRAPY